MRPFLTLAAALLATAAPAADYRVYVGTYTRGGASQGIYRLDLDGSTGQLGEPKLAAETVNPSFLAVRPDGKLLVAVGEGGYNAGVSSFAIDAATGDLQLVNRQSSGGAGPCHVNFSPSGRTVLVANYGGGTVASLPIDADGKLSPAASTIAHRGKGPNEKRQDKPHAHSINLDAAGRFAVAADLGCDKLFVYRLDDAAHTLTPHDPPAADLKPGAGPRHFAFHPTGKFAYSINELDSTVTVFQYDAGRGVLTPVQSVPTLPGDFRGSSTTAEVVVHPSGRFVYGSNRGHDSLAVFAADEATGRLTPTGHVATGGKTPRNFNVTPDGSWLIAANQGSNSLVVFRIDPATGMPKATGQAVSVGAPVCVRFVAK